LFIAPVQGPGQTQVAVDTAPGDPDDPLWEERFAMLQVLVRACLLALGARSPLPSMKEAKARARLYRRVTEIEHSLAMWDASPWVV
jgi:hypothetical protein